ncbi:hypothetical protein JTB14_030230 [Gonioctena quinquepunctata]|nr:hypothetical protein JTB14_030230 [Gonioctena quinquepunctata]
MKKTKAKPEIRDKAENADTKLAPAIADEKVIVEPSTKETKKKPKKKPEMKHGGEEVTIEKFTPAVEEEVVFRLPTEGETEITLEKSKEKPEITDKGDAEVTIEKFAPVEEEEEVVVKPPTRRGDRDYSGEIQRET